VPIRVGSQPEIKVERAAEQTATWQKALLKISPELARL
jgi:hypothetical protein